MEKIQVELNTIDHLDVEDVEHEPCKSHLRGDVFLHQSLKELQDLFRIQFHTFVGTFIYQSSTIILKYICIIHFMYPSHAIFQLNYFLQKAYIE